MTHTATRAIALLSALALVLQACAGPAPGDASYVPETSTERSAADDRQGAELHPKIIEAYGGVYDNPGLAGYVEDIGRRIAAVSEQPDARWTFTVLDTPTVNAFALPGGYVYVTRGLVALAQDEAELAGVIGHEIGHVTAGHSGLRQDRSQLASLGLLLGGIGLAAAGIDPGLALQVGQTAAGGVLASYSRSDELEADTLGVRYISRAGYDPFAQADFLDRLGASSALQARIAGRSYDPNRVDFFASHPATADRTRQAAAVAQRTGDVPAEGSQRNRDRFLDAIDGMIYGDSPAQGFVRGRRFIHPELRFAFTVPEGFEIRNTTRSVLASGPGGGRFIFEGGAAPDGPLDTYIRRQWLPALAKQTRVGQPRFTDRTRIDGLEAAEAVVPIVLNNARHIAILTAVRRGDSVYRMTGITRQGRAQAEALSGAAGSFDSLTAAEAARFKPLRIEIVPVSPGQTVAALASRMETDDGVTEERFRLLNDLGPAGEPQQKDRVKLVTTLAR